MKLGFNEATTLGNSTLERDLVIGEKLGYDYIEIRTMDKLPEYLQTHTVDDLVNFFATSKMKPLAFNTLYPVTFNDAAGDNKEIVDTSNTCAKSGAKIGCKIVIGVCNWDQGIKTKTEIKNETVRMYQKLADIAAPLRQTLHRILRRTGPHG